MSEDQVEGLGPLVRRGSEDVFIHEGVVGKGRITGEDQVTFGWRKDGEVSLAAGGIGGRCDWEADFG